MTSHSFVWRGFVAVLAGSTLALAAQADNPLSMKNGKGGGWVKKILVAK